jgi:hypothetical protein
MTEDKQSGGLSRNPHPVNPVMPSTRNLVIGSLVSLLGAILILVVAVLPAEYGIDPTGIGKLLGLRSISAKGAVAPGPGTNLLGTDTNLLGGPAPLLETGPVWKQDMPYRTDEMSLTLLPNEGAEIKAQMRRGERLVFGWTVNGGKVSFDMHGEATNAPPDAFTSYWRGKEKESGNGAFVAPFDGAHGWYWQNRGDRPVTILVKTSGYYERLYRPSTPPGMPRAGHGVVRISD